MKNALQRKELSAVASRLRLHDHDTALTDREGLYAFIVRDPVKRFVSAFISRLRQGRPLYYHRHSTAEVRVFKRFPTPSDLAEALTSPDMATLKEAHSAMRHIQHVRSPLAYFTGSVKSLEQNKHRIFLVGRTETLDQDFVRLVRALDPKTQYDPSVLTLTRDERLAHKTPTQYHSMQTLSSTAERNVRDWYREDYAIIQWLESNGYLS